MAAASGTDPPDVKNAENESAAMDANNRKNGSEIGSKLIDGEKISPDSMENSVVLVEMPQSHEKNSPGSSSDSGDIEFLEITPSEQLVKRKF